MADHIKDVLIVGAGLAGLMAAISLAEKGCSVCVLEKKELPRHKVCGEFLSMEVLPLLRKYKVEIPERPLIDRFLLSTPSGNSIQSRLPLGGIGITRYTLDQALYDRALQLGAEVFFHTNVKEVIFSDGYFQIKAADGKEYVGQHLLAAYGKGVGWQTHSDILSEEKDIQLGVKQYFDFPMEEDLVVLHNFHGGYCGAVRTENDYVDVAYMVEQNVFRKYKDTSTMEEDLLHANPFLKELMTKGRPILKRPLTISNFQLGTRSLVKDHILFVGDAAAMIPPASGNGMAMALKGGKIAADALHLHLSQKVSRSDMEDDFIRSWNKEMKKRMFWGKQFQKLMGTRRASEISMRLLKVFPSTLPYLVKLTQGKMTSDELEA